MSLNAATNMITLTPAPVADQHMHENTVDSPAREGSSSKKVAKSKTNIPRPPNAFIIYRKELHLKTVAENPGLHNNEISKIIGKKWKDESEDVKDAYKRKADAAKRQHLAENPGYHYQPRKPSEKKKRMTKSKLAKLAAEAPVGHDNTGDKNGDSGVAANANAHGGSGMAVTATSENTVPRLEPAAADSMTFVAGNDEYGQLAADLANFNATHPNLAINDNGMMPLAWNATPVYDDVTASNSQYFPLDVTASNDLSLTGDDFGLDFWTAPADSLFTTNGAALSFDLDITADPGAEVARQAGLDADALDISTFFDIHEFN